MTTIFSPDHPYFVGTFPRIPGVTARVNEQGGITIKNTTDEAQEVSVVAFGTATTHPASYEQMRGRIERLRHLGDYERDRAAGLLLERNEARGLAEMMHKELIRISQHVGPISIPPIPWEGAELEPYIIMLDSYIINEPDDGI